MNPKAELNASDLASMERKSLEAIKERGKAQVGDKTMVDALEPAVLAMEKYQGSSLLEMLRAAEEAAKQGVENTKNYTARIAIGHQDAGATSVWIIFRGMRDER